MRDLDFVRILWIKNSFEETLEAYLSSKGKWRPTKMGDLFGDRYISRQSSVITCSLY